MIREISKFRVLVHVLVVFVGCMQVYCCFFLSRAYWENFLSSVSRDVDE